METRALMLDGLKSALHIKAFWLYLAVSFIGLGVFNGITTWIEGIVRPRGFTPTDAGTLGALMLVGGVLGAVILPSFSDKTAQTPAFSAPGLSVEHSGADWLNLCHCFAFIACFGV